MSRSLGALCISLVFPAACALPGSHALETTPHHGHATIRAESAGSGVAQDEPRLYARDGSVVTPRTPGTVAVATAPQREVLGAEGSRYQMLELYQQVVDERDGLAGELARLSSELDTWRARHAEEQARASARELELASKEAELERLRADNLELAGRLTTAQIRRLQAEKLLLESRLEQQRTSSPTGPRAEVSEAEKSATTPAASHERGTAR